MSSQNYNRPQQANRPTQIQQQQQAPIVDRLERSLANCHLAADWQLQQQQQQQQQQFNNRPNEQLARRVDGRKPSQLYHQAPANDLHYGGAASDWLEQRQNEQQQQQLEQMHLQQQQQWHRLQMEQANGLATAQRLPNYANSQQQQATTSIRHRHDNFGVDCDVEIGVGQAANNNNNTRYLQQQQQQRQYADFDQNYAGQLRHTSTRFVHHQHQHPANNESSSSSSAIYHNQQQQQSLRAPTRTISRSQLISNSNKQIELEARQAAKQNNLARNLAKQPQADCQPAAHHQACQISSNNNKNLAIMQQDSLPLHLSSCSSSSSSSSCNNSNNNSPQSVGATSGQTPTTTPKANGQSNSSSKLHVNFNRPKKVSSNGNGDHANGNANDNDDDDDDSAAGGESRKKKYLTAKYGQQQMNLIKKRLKIEMWLYEQLQELAKDIESKQKADLDEVDIDLDQLLDLDSDQTRRRWLKKILEPFDGIPHDKLDVFIDQVLEQSKLL